MSARKMSRREFLKLSGAVVGGAVLAGCAPKTTEPTNETEGPAVTEAPMTGPVTGNVVLMGNAGELSQDQMDQFQADNPGITIEFLTWDQNRFFAMMAAGAALDILRTQAPIIPSYLARRLLYDLTPYFQTSELIKMNDLAPVNKGYWAESPLDIGSGKIYGMCKDFSPDETIWVNDALFHAAGVTPLNDTTPLTFAQWRDFAKQCAKFEGDRIATWGFGYEAGWTDRFWMVALNETGKSLYKNGFSAVDFGDDTKALADFYYTIAKERITVNPLDASPNGWAGGDFTAGILATMQYGYWFGGMCETDANRGSVRMLPAPTWTGVHTDPTVTATGWVVISKTQVPDAAWKVFEWYMGGQPSIDRAGSGWGVPALKSQSNSRFRKSCRVKWRSTMWPSSSIRSWVKEPSSIPGTST
jgi:multiple sugar transport system substrate-binding protein